MRRCYPRHYRIRRRERTVAERPCRTWLGGNGGVAARSWHWPSASCLPVPSTTPASWLDHQRVFRESYGHDSTSYPRTEIHWRIVDGLGIARPSGIIGLVLPAGEMVRLLIRRLPLNHEPWCAVWRRDAGIGAHAELVFEFAGQRSANEVAATLVGESHRMERSASSPPTVTCGRSTTRGAQQRARRSCRGRSQPSLE